MDEKRKQKHMKDDITEEKFENLSEEIDNNEQKNKMIISGLDSQNLEFKTKVLFGVDKLDVLKKIRNINMEYQRIMYETRLQYEAIIKDKNEIIEQLTLENNRLQKRTKDLENEAYSIIERFKEIQKDQTEEKGI